MNQGLASGDADNWRTAFFRRRPALFRGEAFVEHVIGILDLSAAGAGEIASEQRLQ
jgi:hypothetical protein